MVVISRKLVLQYISYMPTRANLLHFLRMPHCSWPQLEQPVWEFFVWYKHGEKGLLVDFAREAVLTSFWTYSNWPVSVQVAVSNTPSAQCISRCTCFSGGEFYFFLRKFRCELVFFNGFWRCLWYSLRHRILQHMTGSATLLMIQFALLKLVNKRWG
jgi:hypothetical protein